MGTALLIACVVLTLAQFAVGRGVIGFLGNVFWGLSTALGAWSGWMASGASEKSPYIIYISVLVISGAAYAFRRRSSKAFHDRY